MNFETTARVRARTDTLWWLNNSLGKFSDHGLDDFPANYNLQEPLRVLVIANLLDLHLAVDFESTQGIQIQTGFCHELFRRLLFRRLDRCHWSNRTLFTLHRLIDFGFYLF